MIFLQWSFMAGHSFSFSRPLVRNVMYYWCWIFLFGSMVPIVMSYVEVSDPTNTGVQLSVVASCENSATLSWSFRHGVINLKMCELTLYKTDQLRAEIIDIYPDARNHYIQLNKLDNGQSYKAFLVCDGTKRTNDVNFIIGGLCDEDNHFNETSRVGDKIDPVEISRTDTFTILGMLSAILFSSIGVTLVAVVAYYTWKKYQHRQRILRIFRQEQNDPFQALYSPTQDSYSF